MLAIPHDDSKRSQFDIQVKGIAERYKARWGVDIGATKVVLMACPMTGRKVRDTLSTLTVLFLH